MDRRKLIVSSLSAAMISASHKRASATNDLFVIGEQISRADTELLEPVELIGVADFYEALFAGSDENDAYYVSQQTITSSWDAAMQHFFPDKHTQEPKDESASRIIASRDALKKSGDLRLIVESNQATYNGDSLANIGGAMTSSGLPEFHFGECKEKCFDVWPLVKAIANGDIDLEDRREIEIGDAQKAIGFKVDPTLAKTMQLNRRAWLDLTDRADPKLLLAATKDILDRTERYDVTARNLMAIHGNVTFGRPITFSADEMEFELPSSIAREYDVFYVEFAATFRRVQLERVDEIGFDVRLPAGCVALDVAPLAYGVEAEEETVISTPSLTLGPVEIGELYKRRMAMKSIRPTIIAYGKGEDSVTWAISKEAKRLGSHVFAAIVGVPKGFDEVVLGLSAYANVARFNYAVSVAGTTTSYVTVGL